LNLIHIGLGKTATTSLQSYVFPVISNFRPNVVYNKPELMPLLKKHVLLGLSKDELVLARSFLNQSENLISLESLVDWSPRNWEMMADANLELFGKDNHILITVREHTSYLTSLYQQIVHQGDIVQPDEFFVSESLYNALKPILPLKKLVLFDVDAFDLERLYNLYNKRFKKVSIVPLQNIHRLDFIKRHYDFNAQEYSRLLAVMRAAPRSNISYGKLAMFLTFKRESLLKSFGLKSLGSNDDTPLKVLRSLDFPISQGGAKNICFRKLKMKEKIIQFFPRLFRSFSWRALMQGRVNVILPYRKYRLPDSCYINEDMRKRNDDFIKKFLE